MNVLDDWKNYPHVTRARLKDFLVEYMHYEMEDLEGLQFDELTDGLNADLVASYIS